MTVEKKHLEKKIEEMTNPSQVKINRLQEKVRELNNDMTVMQKKLVEKEEHNKTNPPPENKDKDVEDQEKRTVVIITDSSRSNIKPHIKDTGNTKFQFLDNIYTARQLEEEVTNITRNHNEGTHYCVMIGLNDHRKMKLTREVNEQLEKSVNALRGPTAMVQILPIPVHRDITINAKIGHTNDFMENMSKRDAGIIYNKTKELEEMTKDEFLQKDHSFHFTAEAGKANAREIERVWTNKTQIVLYQTETEKNITGFIIGKEGRNINKLKEEPKTEVCIQENKRGKSMITVRGSKRNVMKARDEIEKAREKGRSRTSDNARSKSRNRDRNDNKSSQEESESRRNRDRNERGHRHHDRDDRRSRERQNQHKENRRRETERERNNHRDSRSQRRNRSRSPAAKRRDTRRTNHWD